MSFRGGYGRGKNRGKNRNSPYNKDRLNSPWGRGPGDRGDNRREREGLLPGPPREELFQSPAPPAEVKEVEPPPETENEDQGPIMPKKFTNKARLFFGNLPRDFTESELKAMLTTYGEVQEIYHNKDKNFAFARMVSLDVVHVCECIYM